jgi:hypothetical protein
VETTIGLLLMTIVGLGAMSLSMFAIYNNSGGSDRATRSLLHNRRSSDCAARSSTKRLRIPL